MSKYEKQKRGFFLFRWIDEILNFFARLILTGLIILLYTLQLSGFAFDGKSSSFIWLYYLLVLSFPILVKNLMCKKLHAKILSFLVLACHIVIFFWLYRGVSSSFTYVWAGVTTILFLLRETVKKDDAFSPVVIPYIALGLSACMLFNTLYMKDYLFWNGGQRCENVVYLADMPDVPNRVKEIAESRQHLIVNEKVCVLGEDKYDFRLRPIYNKYFNEEVYRCASVADLEEIVFEIQYVTGFKAHRGTNYTFGFGKGVIETAWIDLKGFTNMLIHPIDTLVGLYKGIKGMLSTLISSPRDLIPHPVKMVSEHLDEIESKIVASNNINKDRIMLPETIKVIKQQRNLYLAGEIGFTAAVIVVPAPKVGVLARTNALMSKVMNRLPIVKKVEKLTEVPYPHVKPPKQLVREMEREAEREVGKSERGIIKVIKEGENKEARDLFKGEQVSTREQAIVTKEMQELESKALSTPETAAKSAKKGAMEVEEKGVDDAESAITKGSRKVESKLLNKKESDERFLQGIKAKNKGIEHFPETALKGGGPNGTRRADHVLINHQTKTKTIVETKSPAEIKNGKGSWCRFNDHLSECRERVLRKFGSCTNIAAWTVVLGCQANSNRTNEFRNELLRNRFKDYKQLTGLAIPKEALGEVVDTLKALGLKETDYVITEIGEDILIELSEEAMDVIASSII